MQWINAILLLWPCVNQDSLMFDKSIYLNSGRHLGWCGVMVARNVVVHNLRTTNPFRSRFDSGHRQIGDFSWFESSIEGYIFFFFLIF